MPLALTLSKYIFHWLYTHGLPADIDVLITDHQCYLDKRLHADDPAICPKMVIIRRWSADTGIVQSVKRLQNI